MKYIVGLQKSTIIKVGLVQECWGGEERNNRQVKIHTEGKANVVLAL